MGHPNGPTSVLRCKGRVGPLYQSTIDALRLVRLILHANSGLVAPGIVYTPMHKNDPNDFLRTLQPLGQISTSNDIAEAVLYLTEAGQVTGEVLHVDGGSHVGRW